jgi:hypothetical protein
VGCKRQPWSVQESARNAMNRHHGRTSEACRITHCVNGFLSFKPCRSYSCPSRRDNSKAVSGLDNWKFCSALCLLNLRFISVKKSADSVYVAGVFLPRILKLLFCEF